MPPKLTLVSNENTSTDEEVSDVEITVFAITDKLIKSLHEQKIILDLEPDYSSIRFDTGIYGGTVIGTLTDLEKIIYYEMVSLSKELDTWDAEVQARTLEGAADATRRQSAQELMSEGDYRKLMDKDEASILRAENFRYQFLLNLFWWNLRYRLGEFVSSLAIVYPFEVIKYERTSN